MGSNPFAPRVKYPSRELQPWEKKTVPEFYWDGETHVWWRCPHMMNFEMLNNLQWHILSTEPLTVKESIKNHKCGCHGFIKKDKWVPAGNQEGESK